MSPALALRAWGLDRARVTPLARSYNTLHLVESDAGRFVLREAPPDRVHEPDVVVAEQALTERAAAAGIAAPRIVPALDGALIVPVGSVGFMLLTWIDGVPPDRPITLSDAHDLGVLAARLHELPAGDRPNGTLDADRVLLFAVPDRLASLRPRYGSVFADAHERAAAAVDALTGPRRLLHGDLTPSNVVRGPGGLCAVDYQDVMWGRIEQDLAHTVYGVARDDADGSLAGALRHGYETIRPFPALDPALLIGRRLQMVNLALTMRRPELEAYLDRHADALREALAS